MTNERLVDLGDRQLSPVCTSEGDVNFVNIKTAIFYVDVGRRTPHFIIVRLPALCHGICIFVRIVEYL